MSSNPWSLLRLLLVFLLAIPALAQEQQDPPPDEAAAQESESSETEESAEEAGPRVLTVDDYERWRRVGSVALAPDGEWMSYSYVPNDGDSVLHVRRVPSGEEEAVDAAAAPAGGEEGESGSTTDDEEEAGSEPDDESDSVAGSAEGDATAGDGSTKPLEIERGSSPAFSSDSAWFTCRVTKSGDRGGRRRFGGPPGGGSEQPTADDGNEVHLIRLSDGDATVFKGASSARFSEDARHVVIRKPRTDRAAKHSGADLLVRDLETGVTRNLGNVSAYAFNEPGTLLAYVVDAAGKHGNGVYLLELAASVCRPLDTGEADFSRLTWNEEGTCLAFLRGVKPDKKLRRENVLVSYLGVATHREERVEYRPEEHEDFPADMVLSERGGLAFSEDASMVFLGLKEQGDEPEKNEEERPDVDVWHWQDEQVQSVQQRRASRDRNFTWQAVLHLEAGQLVRLADEELRSVTITGDGRWGLGSDDRRYRAEVTWGGSRADYYRVDLKTGERLLVTEALARPSGTSPDGRWFLLLKGGLLWSCDLDHGELHDLSRAAPVDFVNHEDDHPYEKPLFGVDGWAADGESVVLRHRFDLWRLALDGSSAENLTAGVGDAEQIQFRLVRLDPEEEFVDLGQPLLLSAYGEWTKKSGFYRLEPGAAPEPLLFDDVRHGRPIKAEDTDRVLVTRETFEHSPDWYVTDTSFAAPLRVTDANPQQAEYLWGRRVLVDYHNSSGVRLQATLTLPAGYEEGRRYPMLVYFYEKMSRNHHSYSFPRFDDRPHMSTYASDGYMVLMPDVVYEIGRPGDSAVDCVGSAVREVIELGFADPDHIGLQGHSWGGYQSSFILTQTDLFCAVVTGAPVTNLVSFYNELYKSSGTVQHGIVERGQVRMGTTPWENMELYRSQSPLHNVRDIETPFLILHGTDDGSVDWHQGLEYFNAARRWGKEVILLSYPGEGHHLAKKPNQIDFQVRMKQFFDHYCKGAPAPSWMTDGVPFLDKATASPRPPREKKPDEKKPDEKEPGKKRPGRPDPDDRG